MYTNVEDVKINSKNKNNLIFAKPTVNWIYNDKKLTCCTWNWMIRSWERQRYILSESFM